MHEQEPVSSPHPENNINTHARKCTHTHPRYSFSKSCQNLHVQTSDENMFLYLAVNPDVIRKVTPLIWLEVHCNSVSQTRNQSALRLKQDYHLNGPKMSIIYIYDKYNVFIEKNYKLNILPKHF